MTMHKAIQTIMLIWGLMTFSSVMAIEDFDIDKDSLHQLLYKNFLDNYNAIGHEKELYQAADEICKYYRKHNLKLNYYKMQLNLCLYDTENNKPMQALHRANAMLEEMKEENFDAYCQVYMALGTIYESRGNYRMAHHYYENALNNLSPEDQGSLMGICSRLCYLQMFRDPVDAKYWNNKYYKESLTFPAYHQVFLFLDALINFSVGNKHGFKKGYDAYMNYHEKNKNLDNYGMEILNIANLVFDENYTEALYMLDHNKTTDLNQTSLYDMRIKIYQMMNRTDLALKTAQQKAECVDSLNSDMFFINLNETNAQTGLYHAKNKAARDHERMLIAILSLLAIIIVLLIFIIIYYRKIRQSLSDKNKKLYTALSMAEEGEKMKSEFVRSVSHEIRTPLNAISGFNQLLNSPNMQLTAEERADLVNRIQENVKAITNIIDEMINVADKESNEFYPKSSSIYCNQFFSTLLYAYRTRTSSAIELKYTTKVINRFQLTTNEEGLRKIVEELIQNAIKFTKEGFIHVNCELSEDSKFVLISVSDSGKGIKKEDQTKIFEGFYKGDSFQQGIGLGLTMSKKIAQKLGGDLIFDENYTKGARFVLSIPSLSS